MSWTDSELNELLGAYALDAVEPNERAAIDEYINRSDSARREVSEFREILGLVGHADLEPPSGLWTKIEGELSEPPPPLRLLSVSGTNSDTRRIRAVEFIGAIAAAVLVVMLTGVVVRLDRSLDDTQAELANAAATMDEMEDMDELTAGAMAAMATPGATRFAFSGSDTESASGVLMPSGDGYFMPAAMTDLDEGKTYQLWATDGEEEIPLGDCGREGNMITFKIDGVPEALMVTIEEETNDGVMGTKVMSAQTSS